MNLDRKQKKSILISGIIIFLFIIIWGSFKLYHIYSEELPSLNELYNIEPSLITRIYAENGEVIKEFYTERRILTPLSQIPSPLITALIATEDNRFYHHWGVDILGIARALLTNLKERRLTYQGGSTITQQLARTLFLTREKTLIRKIKEVLTALKIERTHSKNEILELYLNQSYFGKGAYGVQAASQIYFNKNVTDLTISDCAVLVGLLKAPNRYSPLENPDQARMRRNIVLDNLASTVIISKDQAQVLKKLPLKINPSTGGLGEAPYFTEMMRQYLEEKYGEKMLYSGGLSVYTTLNLELQKTAEKFLLERLDTLQKAMEITHTLQDRNYTHLVVDSSTEEFMSKRVYKQIQGAFVAMDNRNGNVLALIGGKDFERTKFNRATQALRQPGSAFKPFVFTAAVDNGAHPSDIISDSPIILTTGDGQEWKPENFDHSYRGPITLREALADSRNLVSIKLLQKIGPSQAVLYAKRMGIKTPLQAVPSLAIGTSEVSLYDMVSAYSVFPNEGIRIQPKFILEIKDRYGNILEENSTTRREVILDPKTAYIMVSMLQSVINQGTGYGARRYGFMRPAGGKTGTTDESTDNWFVGFTPQITAGVWVGYDDKTTIGINQTGASTALPIWTEFMKFAHLKLPEENFPIPEGIVFRNVCLESGLLSTLRCPKTAFEVYTEENLPERECNIHGFAPAL